MCVVDIQHFQGLLQNTKIFLLFDIVRDYVFPTKVNFYKQKHMDKTYTKDRHCV